LAQTENKEDFYSICYKALQYRYIPCVPIRNNLLKLQNSFSVRKWIFSKAETCAGI